MGRPTGYGTASPIGRGKAAIGKRRELVFCLGYDEADDEAADKTSRPDNDTNGERGDKENSRDSHHRRHQYDNVHALARSETTLGLVLADVFAQK